MDLFSKLTAYIVVACLATHLPLSNVKAENRLNIIERKDFQKRIRVDAITDEVSGQLKDYQSFSFYIKGQLIFCHISKDGSLPAVICH